MIPKIKKIIKSATKKKEMWVTPLLKILLPVILRKKKPRVIIKKLGISELLKKNWL